MCKVLKLSLLILLFSAAAICQISRGIVNEGELINSKILKKDVRYTVYLPYDYDTSNRYYPVLYLLHGYTDNDMGWTQFGEAHMIADEMINSRECPAMIIVMPDADVSWYINNYDGSVKYEDFFIQEFMPFIEEKFRIRNEKRYRALSGLSMGGFGTFIYSLKHPDLFVAAAPLSAAIYTDNQMAGFPMERYNPVFGILYGPDLVSDKRLNEHFRKNNPVDIIKNNDVKKIKSVRYYVDCGDDDYLIEGNMHMISEMKRLEIPVEFRVRDGGHRWSYWRSALPDVLKFVGESFHQP